VLEEYMDYIVGILGTKAVLPIVFSLVLLGPFVVYKLVHNVHTRWLNKVKWIFAVLAFFSCLIIFISTGGFIGFQYDFPALGMGIGLVSFYYAYNGYTSLLPSTCSIEAKSE